MANKVLLMCLIATVLVCGAVAAVMLTGLPGEGTNEREEEEILDSQDVS